MSWQPARQYLLHSATQNIFGGVTNISSSHYSNWSIHPRFQSLRRSWFWHACDTVSLVEHRPDDDARRTCKTYDIRLISITNRRGNPSHWNRVCKIFNYWSGKTMGRMRYGLSIGVVSEDNVVSDGCYISFRERDVYEAVSKVFDTADIGWEYAHRALPREPICPCGCRPG